MTGQELKEKVLLANVPFNVIAERLGITAQSLNSCFKGKDVRSNTIEKIANAIGVSMSFFYPSDSSAVASGDGSVAVSGNNNSIVVVGCGDVPFLQERVKHLEELLTEKERLINILMEGRK